MPTADPSNVLFKIAHPDLYERNPFNLLNLSINATARDIRRRKEDIEAAFDAGAEAEEFRFVLPVDANCRPPTREAVDEAFDALNEPELRIAYALFWFWPDESNPQIKGSDIDERTVVSWGKTGSGFGLVQRHNLAVHKHLSVLSIERDLQKAESYEALDVFAQWKEAIELWNTIVKDIDFWHSVSEMVSSLGDPRLNYRFARSLRDQFAFAFDQINVELAIDFAKAGREADAKLQVEYMRLSQPDADDVEGTFDDAFAGLLRQVEAIVNSARDEVDKNPKSGLTKVDEILKRTKEPVQVSRIIFDKGAPIRESIITTIFAGARNCMVAYGNETKDWEGCLKRIIALKALAENDRQTALVLEDERIIAGNKKYQDQERLAEICWICKKEKGDPDLAIKRPMYGDVNFERDSLRYNAPPRITWKTLTVKIPICRNCKESHDSRPRILFCRVASIMIPLGSLIGAVCVYCNDPAGFSGAQLANGMVAGGFLCLFMSLFTLIQDELQVDDYPPYVELKKAGYQDGEKPPECR